MPAELCRHEIPAADCADCQPRPILTGQSPSLTASVPPWHPAWGERQPGDRWPSASWDGLAQMAAEAEQRKDGLGPWIEARYEGTCRGCGQRWEPGDLIAHDDDEDGWICAMCGSA